MRSMVIAGLVSAALGVPLVAPAPSEAATAKTQATGNWSSKSGEFGIVGAYAFPGKVGDHDEQGILVAVSNVGFVSEILDHYWDREHFINTVFADDKTAVFYLQFDKKGAYRGLSYYFGAGDGCAFCFDSSVSSTVKVTRGRIAGRVHHKDPKGATFDVTFDVPIAPSEYGKALPSGGGEPGKVYRAYHEALAAGNSAALKPLLDADRQVSLKKHAAEFIDFLQKSHPDSYRVTRGFATENHVLLLVTGEKSPLGKVHSEAHLVREGDHWVIDDEILQLGDE